MIQDQRYPSVKNWIVYLSILMLGACSTSDVRRITDIVSSKDPAKEAVKVVEGKARDIAQNPERLSEEIRSIKARIETFRGLIETIWGKGDAKQPGPRDYVKYTDQYYNRAHIDFEAGTVTVETVAPESQQQYLKKAIVTTLLTPADPREVDLYSDATPEPSGGQRPFLYEQVVDQDGEPIAWEWRANRYADHLINSSVSIVRLGNKNGLRVIFPLVNTHQDIRAYQYASLVQKYSRKYRVTESLIYGIMKTESSFNPFAVSSAPAYGLMQIVPSTAGKDVFDKIKGRSGQPSAEYLYDPENNIDTGAAYLQILQERYLADISDNNSKRYSVISAYNGGAGNVLKTFSSNRQQAVVRINQLKPDQVYSELINKHPSQESRRYLSKVNEAQKEFWSNDGFARAL
jgi:membrane-bound lytic murein transglycosylase C